MAAHRQNGRCNGALRPGDTAGDGFGVRPWPGDKTGDGLRDGAETYEMTRLRPASICDVQTDRSVMWDRDRHDVRTDRSVMWDRERCDVQAGRPVVWDPHGSHHQCGRHSGSSLSRRHPAHVYVNYASYPVSGMEAF